MAHYAEIGINNVVKRVLFIDNIKCMTNGGIEKEEIGAAYLETHHGGTWVKCSYNTLENKHLLGGTPLRANYPSVGWYYESGNIKSKIVYDNDIVLKDLIRWNDNGEIIND